MQSFDQDLRKGIPAKIIFMHPSIYQMELLTTSYTFLNQGKKFLEDHLENQLTV